MATFALVGCGKSDDNNGGGGGGGGNPAPNCLVADIDVPSAVGVCKQSGTIFDVPNENANADVIKGIWDAPVNNKDGITLRARLMFTTNDISVAILCQGQGETIIAQTTIPGGFDAQNVKLNTNLKVEKKGQKLSCSYEAPAGVYPYQLKNQKLYIQNDLIGEKKVADVQ